MVFDGRNASTVTVHFCQMSFVTWPLNRWPWNLTTSLWPDYRNFGANPFSCSCPSGVSEFTKFILRLLADPDLWPSDLINVITVMSTREWVSRFLTAPSAQSRLFGATLEITFTELPSLVPERQKWKTNSQTWRYTDRSTEISRLLNASSIKWAVDNLAMNRDQWVGIISSCWSCSKLCDAISTSHVFNTVSNKTMPHMSANQCDRCGWNQQPDDELLCPLDHSDVPVHSMWHLTPLSVAPCHHVLAGHYWMHSADQMVATSSMQLQDFHLNAGAQQSPAGCWSPSQQLLQCSCLTAAVTTKFKQTWSTLMTNFTSSQVLLFWQANSKRKQTVARNMD